MISTNDKLRAYAFGLALSVVVLAFGVVHRLNYETERATRVEQVGSLERQIRELKEGIRELKKQRELDRLTIAAYWRDLLRAGIETAPPHWAAQTPEREDAK